MTDAEAKVLTALLSGPMIPSDIGTAAGGTSRGKAQGLSRLGGGLATRLRNRGLVEDCSFLRNGFPMYRITSAGRAALSAAGQPEGGGA